MTEYEDNEGVCPKCHNILAEEGGEELRGQPFKSDKNYYKHAAECPGYTPLENFEVCKGICPRCYNIFSKGEPIQVERDFHVHVQYCGGYHPLPTMEGFEIHNAVPIHTMKVNEMRVHATFRYGIGPVPATVPDDVRAVSRFTYNFSVPLGPEEMELGPAHRDWIRQNAEAIVRMHPEARTRDPRPEEGEIYDMEMERGTAALPEVVKPEPEVEEDDVPAEPIDYDTEPTEEDIGEVRELLEPEKPRGRGRPAKKKAAKKKTAKKKTTKKKAAKKTATKKKPKAKKTTKRKR